MTCSVEGATEAVPAVGATPAEAVSTNAPVERSADSIWGAIQLRTVHHRPAGLDGTFAGFQPSMRRNP